MAPIDIEEVRRRIEAAELEAYQDQNPRTGLMPPMFHYQPSHKKTEIQEQDTAQNQDFIRPHLSAADKEVIKLLEVVRDIEWVTKDGVTMVRKIKSREATTAAVLYRRGVEVPPCLRCQKLGPFARCVIVPVYRGKSVHRAACSNCIFYHHGTYCSHREEFQKVRSEDWTFEDSEVVLAAGGLRAALRAAGQTGVEFINAQPAAAQPAATQPAAAQPAAAQPTAAQPAATQPAATQPVAAQPAVAYPAMAQPAVAQPEMAQLEDLEAEAQENMQPEGLEMDVANFEEYGEHVQEHTGPPMLGGTIPQDFGRTAQPQAYGKEIQAEHDALDAVVASRSQSPTPQPDPFGLCAYPIDDEDDYWNFRLTPENPRDD
ncbi:hypothetical protein BO78DRAFT_427721 [Aspergillus sclerotiicarbonarius CBS 121057]|uniref:Uncharacterized protein n=1 Tax=Aspergillus sclerotiicarbonarius (strain CBS 121057 / IBT 28362) TaxID=1448318 RepID=A0A319EHF4_ASPSB|nr:hypothetical protein BO78DRAFT_427721 [Aspergillus sclerotiicarbonarius CBS 121057]